MVIGIIGAILVVALAAFTVFRLFRSWLALNDRSGGWWWHSRN